jgi:uncharacterized protein (TIGR02186 family)
MRGPHRGGTLPLAALGLAAVAGAGSAGPRADAASLSVSPRRVWVTSRYHGATLQVHVVAPSGSDIALELEGKRKDVAFNQKGNVFFLWMNVGEVTVGNAPQAYMLFTSTERRGLAPPETLKRLGLGLEALGPEIETRGEGIGRETVLQEFYNYKKKRGLYRLSYGSLRPERGAPGPDGGGRDAYSARIHLPSRVPVGLYEVTLLVFKDGGLVERRSETVAIEKVGLPLLVSRLARDHPGEYGLVAIIVAVVAGYAVGFLFSHLRRRRS